MANIAKARKAKVQTHLSSSPDTLPGNDFDGECDTNNSIDDYHSLHDGDKLKSTIVLKPSSGSSGQSSGTSSLPCLDIPTFSSIPESTYSMATPSMIGLRSSIAEDI
eukprot:Awhi_evm2s10467